MAKRVCFVHYHEIGLKGKNRSSFENQLVTNLHRALREWPVDAIKRISGHILVSTEDGEATDEMAHAISRVPGVARVSLAYVCGLDQEEYCQAAVRALGEAETSTPSRSMRAARPRDTSSIRSTSTGWLAECSARSSPPRRLRCTIPT